MNIVVLIGVLGLVSAMYAALIISKHKKKTQNNHIVSLTITLIATFVGVLLALLTTSMLQVRQDKIRLQSLYGAAIEDLTNCFMDVQVRTQIAEKETSYLSFSPIPTPVVMGIIAQEGSLYRYLSPTLKAHIFSFIRSCTNLAEVYGPMSTPENNVHTLEMLKKELEMQLKFMIEEKQYLAGNRTREQMRALMLQLMNEYLLRKEDAKPNSELSIRP